MKLFSEYGEDRWIHGNLWMPRTGCYVDVGCGHPTNGSNTAWLREFGWWGLNLDGNPAYRPEWEQALATKPGNRFDAALIHTDPKVPFEIIPENSAMSRIKEGAPMTDAITLGDMLERHSIRTIDYMSIDVEGAEYDVFRSFDYKRLRPSIIVAEYNTLGIGEDYRLRDLLLGEGYAAVHQTVANIIYIHAKYPVLHPAAPIAK